MQLFCDLDGVLADFDTHYEAVTGIPADKTSDNVEWDKIAKGHFYRDLPPMPDAWLLWQYIAPFKPIILSGVPYSIPHAASDKAEWVASHLGDVEIRCCFSKDKCIHAKPGDVLIDDWEKHKQKWIEVGGIWITHHSAAETISELIKLTMQLVPTKPEVTNEQQ